MIHICRKMVWPICVILPLLLYTVDTLSMKRNKVDVECALACVTGVSLHRSCSCSDILHSLQQYTNNKRSQSDMLFDDDAFVDESDLALLYPDLKSVFQWGKRYEDIDDLADVAAAVETSLPAADVSSSYPRSLFRWGKRSNPPGTIFRWGKRADALQPRYSSTSAAIDTSKRSSDSNRNVVELHEAFGPIFRWGKRSENSMAIKDNFGPIFRWGKKRGVSNERAQLPKSEEPVAAVPSTGFKRIFRWGK